MKYDFVAFDLDGVLVEPESSWVFVHKHFGTNNDISLQAYNRGEIDDYEFMKRDIALWHSKRSPILYSEIVSLLGEVPLMPGTIETVTRIKETGAKTAIISGGLMPLASRVVEETGIDIVYANDLLIGNDGELKGEGKLVVELKNKRKPFLSALKEFGVSKERTVAIGNSYIDASMMHEAALGIAFSPIDEIVVQAADAVVNERDLRAILPLLGL